MALNHYVTLPASYPGITVNGRNFQAHSRSEQMESR